MGSLELMREWKDRKLISYTSKTPVTHSYTSVIMEVERCWEVQSWHTLCFWNQFECEDGWMSNPHQPTPCTKLVEILPWRRCDNKRHQIDLLGWCRSGALWPPVGLLLSQLHPRSPFRFPAVSCRGPIEPMIERSGSRTMIPPRTVGRRHHFHPLKGCP